MSTGTTLTIRFNGEATQLERAAKTASKTVDDTIGGVGQKSGGRFKTAFSGLEDRFKKLTGIGKRAGEDTGEGFSSGVESKASRGVGKLGTLLKGGLLGIGAKLGLDFMGEFSSVLSGASNLEQSVGGMQAVFGGAFGELDKAAQGANRTLGLSRNSYNELATTLGAGLKNKGIQDFAGETQKLIGLGSDLAAQYGGSTSEAVEAISSLMRGESDPIEKYGVAINETAVNAELAAKGQDKLTGAALDAAKAQARVDILMRQTADAQGAFGRESDTVAGKQQRAMAVWEDMKTKLGSVLMPALSAGAGFLLDTVLPGIERFAGKAGKVVGGLWDFITKGDITGDLLTAFGIEEDNPVLGFFFDLRDGALEVFDQIRGGIDAFVGAWGTVDEAVTGVGFPGWMSDLAGRMQTGFVGIRDALVNLWEKVQPIVTAVWEYLTQKWAEIAPKVGAIFGTISEIISEVMEVIRAVIARVTDVIVVVWEVWGDNILKAIGIVIDTIVGIFGGLFTTIKGIWETLAGLLTGDWEKAGAGLQTITGGVVGMLTSAFDGVKATVVNTFDAMVKGVGAAWDAVGGVVAKPINGVIGFINTGIIGSYNWVAENLGLSQMGTIRPISVPASTSGRSTGGRGASVALAGGGFVRLPWDPANRDPYLGTTPRGAFRFEGEEFFIKRSSTAKLERTAPGLLDHLNRFGELPGHADGGMTTYKGHRFTRLFAGLLAAAEKAAGGSMQISQGGFRPATSYSGTSHRGDAVDIGGAYQRFIAPLRSVGIPTWDRAGKGNWAPHAHGVPLPGRGRAAGSAVWQAQDYLAGGDGLGGRDNGPRGGGIMGAVKWLAEAIEAGFNSVADWFAGIIEKITEPLRALTSSVADGPLGDLVTGIATRLKTELEDWVKDKLGLGGDSPARGYYRGTRGAAAGLAWVHDGELVDFRGGERVYSVPEIQSRRGGGTAADLDDLVDRLVDALASRPVQVGVTLDEGEIRRVVQSETRRHRGA